MINSDQRIIELFSRKSIFTFTNSIDFSKITKNKQIELWNLKTIFDINLISVNIIGSNPDLISYNLSNNLLYSNKNENIVSIVLKDRNFSKIFGIIHSYKENVLLIKILNLSKTEEKFDSFLKLNYNDIFYIQDIILNGTNMCVNFNEQLDTYKFITKIRTSKIRTELLYNIYINQFKNELILEFLMNIKNDSLDNLNEVGYMFNFDEYNINEMRKNLELNEEQAQYQYQSNYTPKQRSLKQSITYENKEKKQFDIKGEKTISIQSLSKNNFIISISKYTCEFLNVFNITNNEQYFLLKFKPIEIMYPAKINFFKKQSKKYVENQNFYDYSSNNEFLKEINLKDGFSNFMNTKPFEIKLTKDSTMEIIISKNIKTISEDIFFNKQITFIIIIINYSNLEKNLKLEIELDYDQLNYKNTQKTPVTLPLEFNPKQIYTDFEFKRKFFDIEDESNESIFPFNYESMISIKNTKEMQFYRTSFLVQSMN